MVFYVFFAPLFALRGGLLETGTFRPGTANHLPKSTAQHFRGGLNRTTLNAPPQKSGHFESPQEVSIQRANRYNRQLRVPRRTVKVQSNMMFIETKRLVADPFFSF